MRVTAWSTPWSIVDGLADEGVALSSEVDSAARTLSDELNAARNGRNDRPENERRLPEAFSAADSAFAQTPNLHPRLASLLVEAAATLAHDPRVAPGTAIGDRVAELLLEAADSDDAGKFSQ